MDGQNYASNTNQGIKASVNLDVLKNHRLLGLFISPKIIVMDDGGHEYHTKFDDQLPNFMVP